MRPLKWKTALGAVLTSLLVTVPGMAQKPAKTKSCLDKAMTQAAINACASRDAARADAELNVVYKRLLAAAAGQTQALDKIRAAERAWILYRDAYMDAMFPATDKLAAYGSIYPTNADLMKATVTESHVKALKTMLDSYDGKLNTVSP